MEIKLGFVNNRNGTFQAQVIYFLNKYISANTILVKSMFIAWQQLSFVLGIIYKGILCLSRGAYQCDVDKACAAPF